MLQVGLITPIIAVAIAKPIVRMYSLCIVFSMNMVMGTYGKGFEEIKR